MLALDVVSVLAYPFAAWYVLTQSSIEAAGGLLLLAMAPRLVVLLRRSQKATRREILGPPLLISALVLAAIAFADPRFLLILPVLISLTLLGSFARTLWATPMVEHFARLSQPDLTAAEVRHCRQATWLWCGFFTINAVINAALAWRSDPSAWALYTGLWSYVAMAAIFATEYALRVKRFGFARATPGWSRLALRVDAP